MVRIIQEEQFINYIKLYERLIFSICLSFTKNYFDAEDLAQKPFCPLIGILISLTPESQSMAYYYCR